MRLPLFSTSEAARMYRVHPRTIRKWAANGQITNHGTATRARWNPAELEQRAREAHNRNRPNPPAWPLAA